MRTHYEKLNPFSPLSDNTEIIGDNISLGFLDRRMTGDFRLLSAKGVEVVRCDDWAGFMRKVFRYAQEKDVIVDYSA